MIYHGIDAIVLDNILRPSSLDALTLLFFFGFNFFLVFFRSFININNLIFELGIYSQFMLQPKLVRRSSMWPLNEWIRNILCILHQRFLCTSDFHRLEPTYFMFCRLGRLRKNESLSPLFNNNIRGRSWNQCLHNKSDNLILLVFLFLQQPRRSPNITLYFIAIPSKMASKPKFLVALIAAK